MLSSFHPEMALFHNPRLPDGGQVIVNLQD
jgi:hypothetical protein